MARQQDASRFTRASRGLHSLPVEVHGENY
jgi:hypothetical protein